jgi:regulator of RNase E activity RraA
MYTRLSSPPICFMSTCLCLLFFAAVGTRAAFGQDTTPEPVYILQNKSFDDTEQTRNAILAAYEGLRVADVTDALDRIGLQDITLFDESIRPIWRDFENYSHHLLGFALTVRYVPSDVRKGTYSTMEEARAFTGQEYGRAGEDFMDAAKPGDVLVVDQTGAPEGGHIGSNNSLQWAADGMTGVLTDGGTRDTDEIAKTRAIPVYTKYYARGIRPGRIIMDAYNVPIEVGGVLVYPGDLIMADGDGALSVPREHVLQVAEIAHGVMAGDQRTRARFYERLGIPLDETVQDYVGDE